MLKFVLEMEKKEANLKKISDLIKGKILIFFHTWGEYIISIPMGSKLMVKCFILGHCISRSDRKRYMWNIQSDLNLYCQLLHHFDYDS